MKKQLTILILVSLAIGILLAACGVPELPSTSVAEATIALTPTPTATPTFTPSPTPTFTPTPTPTHTPTPKAASQAQGSGQTAKPLATATPAEMVLVVTEQEANKMAAEALAQQQDVQIDNPHVDFRPGEIYVSGDATIGFFKLNIGILATVEAVNGKPEVTVQEIYVNDARATGFIRDQIEAMIAPHLDQLAAVSEDFYVESITITDDEMIIKGRFK